jgi:Na+/H+ antiporter NhaD/arsenite permease-like protein
VIDEPADVFASPALLAEEEPEGESAPAATQSPEDGTTAGQSRPVKPLPIFQLLERVEWDTLIFFYGVLLGVGGLGALGYLAVTSQLLYEGLGPTVANVLVGLLSAVVDNVPVMFAVLSMNPAMAEGQWLLVTLTAGVGGSLLSIGSAAGVALMGQARGVYTFGAHLRWSWAIALGYAASIGMHLLLNRHLF